MVQQPSYWKVLTRRKILSTEGHETETKLNRVLGLYDLTALGVGSTLGAGVYVLAGQIAKEQAGPSVMLSFAIAALASLLAGICYAEFGARVPKAGSAYVYSYVCIGEFAAFVIGWNLILEYVIGTAAVCRGISLYLDTLISDTLKNTFAEVSPMNISFLGSYFDWFAFGLVVVFGVALAFGVEASAMANNFCTCLNISVLLFVIVAGSIKANFQNWSIDINAVNATDVTSDLGTGGYFPFGFSGTLRGAATCFFGFVGFDCIATTGEEVRNPRRNIPRSILLSLFVIFLCYFGVSTVLTLMVPYYKQDPNAPLPYAFKEVGWTFAMWIVSIGGLVGLLASLFGALFPLPRVMYSMAEDGLLFHFLGKISPRFQVPVIGSIFAAVMTALIAGLFDLNQLVSLLSIGTLLAYSVVAISVTILRYMDNTSETSDRSNGTLNGGSNQNVTETSLLNSYESRITFKTVMVQLFNCRRLKTPNTLSARIVGTSITLFCLLSIGIGLIFMEAYDALINNQIWVLVVLGILVFLTFLVLLVICLQPREIFTPRIKVFRVPFVPIVPAISIFINIYLMLQLDAMTWIRFGIWMAIGLPMFIACYCMYDLKNAANRSVSRVAFEKALKAGARGEDIDEHDIGNSFGFLPNNLDGIDVVKANGKTNGVVATANFSVAQNQLSLKSLDEIVNMNDIGEELIELRHANGKVFYIEDNRSHASTTTLERENIENNLRDAEVTEEEKSVIALLDDVLQNEDDGGNIGTLSSPSDIHDYNRKFSVDSEMLPSVIETTIVATVHSSSDSSEHDLDDVPEVNEEQSSFELENTLPLHLLQQQQQQRQHKVECTHVAQQLVDEILKSEEIQQILKENAENSENAMKRENDNEKLQRKASQNSILSVEDPLHSSRFKLKLSQLIMQQPTLVPLKSTKENQNSTIAIDDGKETTLDNENQFRPKLKHSKSEADVRKVILGAIEARGIENQQNSLDTNGIPTPPKFDPVLYKTINSSFSANKTRPRLDKMMKNETLPIAKVQHSSLNDAAEDALPFKTKLEAILRRGPSHRTQRNPDSETRTQRRAKTMIDIQRHNDKENNATANAQLIKRDSKSDPVSVSVPVPVTVANSTFDTSESDTVENIIMNARKSLRHIENNALKS